MNKIGKFLLVVIMSTLASNCSRGEIKIREKINIMLDEDMSVIKQEINTKYPSALLARPYYRIVEYSVNKNNSVFSHQVVVEFYYMDSILIKQIRTYRYLPSTRSWDGYDKNLQCILN